MSKFLTEEERIVLKQRHRKERDRRTADRIKAVLWSDKGWSYKQIAEALFLDEETVSKQVDEYRRLQKLGIESGGSESKLSEAQTQELMGHLETNTYVKVIDICEHVSYRWGVVYTVRGMYSWLKSHGFSYKKPKQTPAKADPAKQAAFVEEYKKLMEDTPKDEPILFLDAVHPTMATKVTYGWIKTGSDKPIYTTASRTRVNVVGALNLSTMQVDVMNFSTVNSEAMEKYFKFLKSRYPNAPKLHVILDNGPYNTSKPTREAAKENAIVLHHLPPYSPNLNPIERLWKVMNEYARNNRFFSSAKHFRDAISQFFEKTWISIASTQSDL